MKKIFTMAIACMMAAVCTLSANAQVVVHEGGGRDALLVPSALTVDGKARITIGSPKREVSIYNKNFEKEASITPVTYSYRSGSITQEATVTVTGAALISKDPFQYATKYSRYNSEKEKDEPVSATSLEEGVEKLKEIDPFCTDDNCKIYNISNYSFIYVGYNYYEQSIFGTQYPSSGTFYICKDGFLWFAYTSLNYELQYDESSALWTTTADYSGTSESNSIVECRHVNADEYSQIANSDNDEQLVCTQNFFNDDEEWEYLQYTYDDYETISVPVVKQKNNDGTVTLSRTISIGNRRTGIRVINQSGNVALSMSFPTPLTNSELNLWTVNGKSYIEINRDGESTSNLNELHLIEFYEIEKGTSNVRKVLEREVPKEEMNEDATIYDLSGRVLNEKPATGVYIQGGKKYLAK